MSHFMRSFAVGQFNKLCPLPEEQRILVQQDNMLRNIRVIKVMCSVLCNDINIKNVACTLLMLKNRTQGTGFKLIQYLGQVESFEI
jgi:hypothetical protein